LQHGIGLRRLLHAAERLDWREQEEAIGLAPRRER
jgi:hypothetical protein